MTSKYLETLLFVLALSISVTFCFGEVPQKTDENQVNEYFNLDPTDDQLEPTPYILVDGEPVRLKDDMNFQGKDLSGVRIHNMTLHRVDFRGANLCRADLSQSRFFDCNFSDANLESVDSDHVVFPGCDFSGASVKWSRSLELTYDQYVSTSDYQNKCVCGRTYTAREDDFSRFHFKDAAIIDAQGCGFTDALFVGNCTVGRMTREQFVSTLNYKKKEFTGWLSIGSGKNKPFGIDLSHCRIEQLTLRNSNLSGADFTEAVIWNFLQIHNCDNLTSDQLKTTWNWKNRTFNYDLLTMNVDWSKTDFSEFTFAEDAVLGYGSVRDSDFSNSKIDGGWTFIKTPDLTVEQIKSTWNFKNREMRFHLGKTDLDWSGTDFSNFSFEWDNLDGADISGADFTNAMFYGFYSLEKCRGLTIEQIKSTRNYKTGYMNMKLPQEIADQLRAEKDVKVTAVSDDSKSKQN